MAAEHGTYNCHIAPKRHPVRKVAEHRIIIANSHNYF
jgi:hypothetical protein